MINIEQLRQIEPRILAYGNHQGIIQSILDFDYLSGKQKPSIVAIIGTGRRFARYFFGKREILLPIYSSPSDVQQSLKDKINFCLNVGSARRVLSGTKEVFDAFPNMLGESIFAEDVPEEHSLKVSSYLQDKKKFAVGPASVGLLIPNKLKFGAIGGVDVRQLVAARVFTPGSVAVFSASGGMTNELINILSQNAKHLSFALSFGGDRFPILSPRNAFLIAEEDPQTNTIVYYGELGGTDEYELAELLKEKKVTKKVIAYIAGTVSDIFPTPPQFGHAKAMAKTQHETAQAKRQALLIAGAIVPLSFTEFVLETGKIEDISKKEEKDYTMAMDDIQNRRHALITTSISKDENSEVKILGEELLSFSTSHSFGYIVASLFLGQKIKSKELEEFVDFVLRLLVDHGPYVSGAVNTIVTSRAGRDLVSSLSAGLLTIGPRFGGAINEAAANWIKGVIDGKKPYDFVEDFASRKVYISGIGHRKYRVDFPDPRVKALLRFIEKLEKKRFSNFAKEVEKITTDKKGNLILNVDGTIAAVLLDILSEKERLSDLELKELTETEFFNGLFVLSRSVGFIAHFLDQKRLDEGLFRLDEDMVASAETPEKL